MATTYDVCENVLSERIANMKKYIKKAELLISAGDLMQGAVRLELAAKEAYFDQLMMSVFDSVSRYR
jgi:hypothetical protein